jgi:hypothetical protein
MVTKMDKIIFAVIAILLALAIIFWGNIQSFVAGESTKKETKKDKNDKKEEKKDNDKKDKSWIRLPDGILSVNESGAGVISRPDRS